MLEVNAKAMGGRGGLLCKSGWGLVGGGAEKTIKKTKKQQIEQEM